MDPVIQAHLGGKIRTSPIRPVGTREDLAIIYTPGVGRICTRIAECPEEARRLTTIGRTVAIITDGSAVLGLGDIGPAAAMPVMEGKAMLFHEFGGLNAIPILLDTQDVEGVVSAVKAIAPTFGAINLEDIAAPRCFEIERRLREELSIPVFHDDQQGTAVVAAAGLMNAFRITGRTGSESRIVVNGAGAAGNAVARFLVHTGIRDVVVVDSRGALVPGREGLGAEKEALAAVTNPRGVRGSLGEVLEGADAFVGVSVKDALKPEMIRGMAEDPIVFALANPDPEIDPALAAPLAAVVATGRSDFPNQVNNALAFPGIFKGTLDGCASEITIEMMEAASGAIADAVSEADRAAGTVIPDIFRPGLHDAVARAVAERSRGSDRTSTDCISWSPHSLE